MLIYDRLSWIEQMPKNKNSLIDDSGENDPPDLKRTSKTNHPNQLQIHILLTYHVENPNRIY